MLVLKRLVVIACAFLMMAAAYAADDNFVVDDIRLDGLGRISEGTIFNYLPVNVGDQMNRQRLTEAFRVMYGTGFFDDVEFRRDGNTLVIRVVERPSIASFTIEGNKDIKTEDLENNLGNVGLKRGGSFNRSVLDNVKQVLTQEYFARGKYGASVDTSVTEIDNNQVRIAIDITEGKRARIRQINIVGNELFSEKELLREFKMKTPNFQALWKKNDRYSREVLGGDLETLTSFYMDKGYANFDITSTQVAITPDKKDIYITINIDEGERFTIADVSVSGDTIVPAEQLERLILLQPGQLFNRKALTSTTELMTYRLGQDGFSRANIMPVPEINEEDRTVSIDFRVDPGERVYVRRIEFNGTKSINDDVLRREMRQFEGAALSNVAVERSEERVRRLPFIEEVSVETVPVPGSPDLVDVEFEIKEGLPGQFGGGVGYSGSQGVLLNGNFTHTNFLGSGERVAAAISTGRFQTIYSIAHNDLYRTPEGIGRNVSLSYSDRQAFTSASSDFSIKSLVGSVEYSWPISEYSRIQLGGLFLDTEQVTTRFSSDQSRQFVRTNGNPYTISAAGDFCGASVNDICGTRFRAFELFAGFVKDTRDRVIFPTRGARHVVSFGTTVPGSEVEYYSIRYDMTRLWNIFGQWTVGWNMELGFGEPLGESTDLPPSKLFFVGGPETVRGFENSRLGPLDSRGNPNGGNAKFVSQLELLLPTPDRLRASTRFSLFWDVGNVFYTGGDISFTDCIAIRGFTCSPRPVDYGFDVKALRQSAGVAVQWLAPLGTFRFSYAVPITSFPGSARLPEDRIERFQFSVGSTF